jgi:hypothetical protein
MSLFELAHEADAISEGIIVEQDVYWSRGELYTLNWLAVTDRFLGGDDALIPVVQLGGAMDGIERKVSGLGRLGLGDHIIAFTRTDGVFHYLVGLGQGAYHIDAARVSRRDLPTLARPLGPTRPLAPDRATLPDLRREIARLIATRGDR